MRNRTSLFGWLTLLGMIVILTGCGSGSSSTPATGPTAQGGVAVDPYIVGAIFQEVAQDGTLLQSQSTPSDANGRFEFPKPLTSGSIIESKPSARGMHNGTPYQGILRRQVDDSDPASWVVSPLTTLIARDLPPQQVLDLFANAGISGLTLADLTVDPMAGIPADATTVANINLAPLQAAMAANAFMGALDSYNISADFMADPNRTALLTDMATAATEILNSGNFNALATDPAFGSAPLVADDFIRTAANLCQIISDRARQDGAGFAMGPALSDALLTAPALAHQYHQDRIGDPPPGPGPNPDPTPAPDGAAVYTASCASCHKFGTTDTTGFAPDQNNLGGQIAAKLAAGHNGIALSATETEALAAYITANSVGTTPPPPTPHATPDPTPGPTPHPGPGPGPRPAPPGAGGD
jgi:mono/diheme cytochrome c family protein